MNASHSPALEGTDPTSLSEHFQRCVDASGPWYRLACTAEAVHGFLGRRFITTLGAALLFLCCSAWLPM